VRAAVGEYEPGDRGDGRKRQVGGLALERRFDFETVFPILDIDIDIDIDIDSELALVRAASARLLAGGGILAAVPRPPIRYIE